jgi:hypothetical protein
MQTDGAAGPTALLRATSTNGCNVQVLVVVVMVSHTSHSEVPYCATLCHTVAYWPLCWTPLWMWLVCCGVTRGLMRRRQQPGCAH